MTFAVSQKIPIMLVGIATVLFLVSLRPSKNCLNKLVLDDQVSFLKGQCHLQLNKPSKSSVLPSMTNKVADEGYISYVGHRDVICKDYGYFGKKGDGGWNMCKTGPFNPQKPCIIYSFGINFDFSFDDKVADVFGCTVRSFDPSMNVSDHRHSDRVWFYKLGLDGSNHVTNKGWRMKTLKSILQHLGDSENIITYIKFDVEGSEWPVIKRMTKDGSLKNVMQLAFETHTPHKATANNMTEYYEILHGLENIGFRRWHTFRRGGRFKIQHDMVYINVNFCQ